MSQKLMKRTTLKTSHNVPEADGETVAKASIISQSDGQHSGKDILHFYTSSRPLRSVSRSLHDVPGPRDPKTKENG